jgi:GcrA cell cycle regulator
MTVVTWTDDRVEQLKKLWEAGHSASQIAAELGNVTRNAVIGKVHRLGLSGRAKAPSSAMPRQRKVRTVQQHVTRTVRPVARGNTALAQVFEVEVEADPIAQDNVVPMGQRITLIELNDSTCRWPIGDPGSSDFAFCGGKTMAGMPYCSHHCRIAYQPVSDRRRDRRPVPGK